jgi:hypothetical protein
MTAATQLRSYAAAQLRSYAERFIHSLGVYKHPASNIHLLIIKLNKEPFYTIHILLVL